MQEGSKKDYPPGWNDPPMLSNSSSNTPPKSRISAKRVAFPLSSASSQGNVKCLDPAAQNQCLKELYTEGKKNFSKLLETTEDENIKLLVTQLLNDWETNKFSSHLQNLLCSFLKNLVDSNTSKAKEIHLQFMMDNSSDFKKYFPLLDQLINIPK